MRSNVCVCTCLFGFINIYIPHTLRQDMELFGIAFRQLNIRYNCLGKRIIINLCYKIILFIFSVKSVSCSFLCLADGTSDPASRNKKHSTALCRTQPQQPQFHSQTTSANQSLCSRLLFCLLVYAARVIETFISVGPLPDAELHRAKYASVTAAV